MSTFKHNNIDIKLEPTGRFVATVNGTEITASSLPAMKKKLDKIKPFEPFKAFTIDKYYHEDGHITMHEVIGLRKDRGRASFEFRTKEGRTMREVYRATPENLKRANAWLSLVKKNRKIRDAQDLAESKMENAIGKEISPRDLDAETVVVVEES